MEQEPQLDNGDFENDEWIDANEWSKACTERKNEGIKIILSEMEKYGVTLQDLSDASWKKFENTYYKIDLPEHTHAGRELEN